MTKLKPFAPKLTPQQREDIRNAPATMHTRELALQYGVDRRAIEYHRKPEMRIKENEIRRNRFRALALAKNGVYRRYKEPKIERDKYEQMIHDAIVAGTPAGELEHKIDRNLSDLIRERAAIDARIDECRKAQKAYYRYMNPTPEIISAPDLVIRENRMPVYMTQKDMKMALTECGLTMKKLVKELNGRYSMRALSSYRQGQAPVPRPVADFLRGYPRKPTEVWR